MDSEEVIRLLKEARVEEALAKADAVEDKAGMAAKLTEFAGALNYLKGRPGLTEAILYKSLILDPKNPVTYYNLGVLMSGPDLLAEDEGNLGRAVKAYEAALKLDPEYHQARYNLALLLFFSGRLEDAEREYGRILTSAGDLPEYRELGLMLWDTKRKVA